MSNWKFLNQNRVRTGFYASDDSYGFNGMFEFAIPGEPRRIRCVASDGEGWQHVSVSFGSVNRSCPPWQIMCAVKDLFWEQNDAVIQIHPPRKNYVNMHGGCLHLWRVIDGREQPLPPSILVGLTDEQIQAITGVGNAQIATEARQD